MDVPSPVAGRIGELKIKRGDRVSTGGVLLSLEPTASTSTETQPPKPANAAAPAAPPIVAAAAPRAESDAAVDAAPRVVTVPDLGDFADVEIIEILVKPGDRVASEQGVVTLETEKASMDVPAPEAGEIVELKVKLGDRVSTGAALLVLKPVRTAA